MTYCFAFNTEPDGIGIIADTRITIETDLGQLQQIGGHSMKVYQLGSHAFVALAGRLDHIAMVLWGIEDRLGAADPAEWFDVFIDHCEANFYRYRDARVFSMESPPEVALIYADVRHKRGATNCRLVRLVFGPSANGPAVLRTVGPQGGSVAIGWTPEGRAELNEAAKSALGELYNRHLEIRDLTQEEIRTFHVAPAPGPLVGFALDTRGPPDASFSPVLRRYCADKFQKGGPTLPFEPVTALCGAALAAVEGRMAQLRREQWAYAEGVGQEFSSGSLTLRHGFQLYFGPNLAAISQIVTALRASR